jgi:hypothetical protein
VNWKELGRKWSRRNSGNISEFTGRVSGNARETSAEVISVLDEI